ncbi:MAG: acyl carrier protein [Bdellovibrionaceae bacterium]|nr:acyl carrier protein [Pseudobdellovibrionaceae bacterium]
MELKDKLLKLIDQTLKLNGRGLSFTEVTKLLGAVPELDSLMVANLLTQIETEFQIRIEDDEIDGTLFATVGSLLKFIEQKKSS